MTSQIWLTTYRKASLPMREVSKPLIPLSDLRQSSIYEGWNFNSGNYLFTTDIK